MGILGGIILFASAILLISQIEYNLNALWGTPKKRALLRRIFTYYPVITIIPFLVAGSLFLSTNIQSIMNKTYYASILYNMIAPYLMITIAFVMMYKTLPNTQVEWKAAITSGITASVLWENSKFVFAWYIKEIVSYDKIYGSLSILPIFLLYIFLCWLIIYFAAEVGVVTQNFSGQKAKKHFKILSIVDYISVLHLICLNHSTKNRSTKLAYISKSLSIPNDTVIQIVDHLKSLDAISKTGRHQYSPTKPIENINVSQLLDAFFRINPDSQYITHHPKYADFIYKLRSGTIDIVKDDNFKDLMKPL
jgi:membrane protein